MSESLGAWTNAPLAYVLAEVRTEQLADLKEYKSKLSAVFRSEYPIQRTMHSAKFVATNTGLQQVEPDDQSAWEFATPDNHTAVIARANGLILHATKYIDSSEFLGRLYNVVEIVAKEIPAVYVNRFGLRYVDFIIPKVGEQPEDYIDGRLNPVIDAFGTTGMPRGMSLALYPVKNGALTLRYVRGRGQPELPPDLSTFALEKSPLMQKEGLASDQPTAILDTDRVREFPKRELLDSGMVRREFAEMRLDISRTFNALLTKHARKMWGAK
jgi:uncharacterized protein (TIGR04255 family)